MSSTIALFTGLSGLNANARQIEVVGNNIANVNTNGYKATRLLFSDMIKQNIRTGAPPSEDSGGVNPTQIGLGVSVGGTLRDFKQGSISATGDARDMAVEGEGFFIVERGGERFYTRSGAFRQDENNDLVTIDGDVLLGYGVDDRFNVQQGGLTRLNIPIGTRSIAEASSNVRFGGNLNAAGELPTGGAIIELLSSNSGGFSLIPGATVPALPGSVIDLASLLTEIENPAQPGSGTPLFADGQRLQLNGARKGGAALPVRELVITQATTVQNFLEFLNAGLGLRTELMNPDGLPAGAMLDPANGVIVVSGNTGTANDLEMPTSGLRLLNQDGTLAALPFAPSKLAEATGESQRTSFIVYDSLGSEIDATLTMVLEAKTDIGTTWRYYVESPADTDGDVRLTTGTVSFDSFGAIVNPAPVQVRLDRNNTGAVTPLTFDIHFSQGEESVTALAGNQSQIASTYRDGRAPGALTDFSVDREGTIYGSFSNGLIRPLGRVVLASFSNAAGLVDVGSNLFRPGANSGEPVLTTPTTFGAGSIVGGALELSNVDLGQEFIKLILSSTGYAAASRVIRTADELVQQLLVMGR
ncbi:MAG: flagellar hook-basal body complex protein [Phycisphaeraceae bacterium]|nr:flagellar hook-basal body complex protein [Phycisphaeraceae bacterium]